MYNQKIKGVILAGGSGTRLMPLTGMYSKHLLPVGPVPMIVHAVRKLTEAGITDIVVVSGTEHLGDIMKCLGSGSEYDCCFTYLVQDKAGGIAEALGLVRSVVSEDERMVVILGDNIFEDSLLPFVEKYYNQSTGAKVVLTEVEDPCRFGVADVRVDSLVPDIRGARIKYRRDMDFYSGYDFWLKQIVEKPSDPPSNLIVSGIYFYDYDVFSIIDNLVPSDRGELEITDVNSVYLESFAMTFDVLTGWWTDAGTFESYRRANELIWSTIDEV